MRKCIVNEISHNGKHALIFESDSAKPEHKISCIEHIKGKENKHYLTVGVFSLTDLTEISRSIDQYLRKVGH